MVQFLIELLAELFLSSAGPWRYLVSAKYRRETHSLWRRQSRWLTACQIALGLLIYGIALGLIAFFAGLFLANGQS